MFPAQVIDAADLGDLDRAIVRHLLPLVEQGYYYSRRSKHPIEALAETMPRLTDEQPTAEGAAYPAVGKEEVA